MVGMGFGFSTTSSFSSSSTFSSPFSFGFSNPSSNPTSTTSPIFFGVGSGTAHSTTGSAATTFGGSSAPTNASSSASSAPRFSFAGASGSPGFAFPAASATGLGTAATTAAASFSTLPSSASSDFSFLKSTTSLPSGATSSSTLPSFGTTGFQSSTLTSPLSSVPTSKAAAAGATPSATTASFLSAATASSTASSGLTVPVSIGTDHAVSTSLDIVTSVPSSGFTGFSAASAPELSSGASNAFSLSLKTPVVASSVSSQSSGSALPSLGAPSMASTTPISSTAGSSAQTTSSLVVSSSSGTTSTTSIASAPKLPSEITGRTVEKDLSARRAMVSIIEDDTDFDFSFLSSGPSQPVSSSFTSSDLELATAKTSLRHFLNMNLSTLGTMEKATVLSAAFILKSSPEFSQSSAFDIIDTLDSMFTSFQESSSTCSETLIQVGNFKAQKMKLDGMLSERKNVSSILQQKNKDFDAKEELVKRLETELAQHKADMMTLLHDSEVLKASFDELKFGIQSLGDELVNQKEAYQHWEDTLKKAEAARADCHSKWEYLRKLDLF